MILQAAKGICQKHHDALELCMRFGAVTKTGAQQMKYSGGCYGSIVHMFLESRHNPYVYVPYHGDGCVLSLKALCDLPAYNKEMADYPRDWNKFEGTERSMIWTKYLLSDHSQWRDLTPFLAEADAEYCNTAGFIFHNCEKMPTKLFYNFLMAIRLPWELSKVYAHWLLLREKLDDRLALFIASNFELRQSIPAIGEEPAVTGATSLETGPWDIIYPWSYLENTTLEAAGRFIRCAPGTLSTTEALSPNVSPLWATPKATEMAWDVAEKLNKNEKLTLPEIVTAVEGCVSEQEKLWK